MLRNGIAVCIAAALLVAHPHPAAACSAGPDFDPRDHTQLLVLGRARSIELGHPSAFGIVPATVTLDVMHVFRGDTASPLRFVDRASIFAVLDPQTGKERNHFGGGGSCGTLDDDPVGKHVLIALARGEDSRWHANRLFGAIYTDQPDYAMYRWVLERHGVAVPFLITGPATDAGAFGPALAP